MRQFSSLEKKFNKQIAKLTTYKTKIDLITYVKAQEIVELQKFGMGYVENNGERTDRGYIAKGMTDLLRGMLENQILELADRLGVKIDAHWIEAEEKKIVSQANKVLGGLSVGRCGKASARSKGN